MNNSKAEMSGKTEPQDNLLSFRLLSFNPYDAEVSNELAEDEYEQAKKETEFLVQMFGINEKEKQHVFLSKVIIHSFM